MSKPGNWDLVGGDPAPGDPGAFDRLVTSFNSTAEAAGGSSGQLQRLCAGTDDSIWSGQAADAFREELGKLPGDLVKLHDSYCQAACAMQSHAATLRDLQGRARDALDVAVTADEDIRQAEQAATAPTISAAGPVIAPAGPSPAEQALDAAKTRLANAKAQIHGMRDEAQNAETRLLSALETAHRLGIQNKAHHWWSGIADGVVHAAHAVGDIVHKSLRSIGDIADRFSDILTVVSVALVAVAAVALIAAMMIGTGGTAGFALAFVTPTLLGAAESVGGVALTAKLVSVGAETSSKAAFHDSDLHWGELAKEGGMAVLARFGVAKIGKAFGESAGTLASKARNLLPIARDGAEAGQGLSLLDRSPGLKRVVDVGKDFSQKALLKAKPLIEQGKTWAWGTEQDPKFLQKGVELKREWWGTHDEAGLAQHAYHGVKDGREMINKFSEEPLRLTRPIEFGPERPSLVEVPCKPVP